MSGETSNQAVGNDLFADTSLLENLVNRVDKTTAKSIVGVCEVQRRIQRNGHLYRCLQIFHCKVLNLDKRKG
jgi:hypothetical protein